MAEAGFSLCDGAVSPAKMALYEIVWQFFVEEGFFHGENSASAVFKIIV